mgnify:FL=1
MIGVTNLSGPIVSWLIKRFGLRAVSISGAMISSIALFLSTMSPNVIFLMIIYGIIGGFGAGMIYLTSIIIVGYYFESKRALATGIAVCGTGVGSIIVPPLANHIFTHFGSLTSIITLFGGMFLSCIIFGCLMKPLDIEKMPDESEQKKEIKLSGCIKNIVESKEMPDQSEKGNKTPLDTKPEKDIKSNEVSDEKFNGTLLKNTIFISLCLCYSVGTLGMYVPYIFLPNMAELRGISKDKSDYLLSIIGMCAI